MARSQSLVTAIKRELKSQGLSYKSLAKKLDLSESAVKQMFAGENMTLKRVDAICDVLRLDLDDLVRLAADKNLQLDMLSVAQEKELIGDAKLLLVAYCLINNWSFQDIVERYTFTEHDCIHYMARLDKMRLIDLLPGNRIKPLISINFQWQKDGPIERYFRGAVQDQFFNSSFTEKLSLRLVKNGDLTPQAIHQLMDRMNSAGQLFDDLTREERKLPPKKRTGATMVLALRHWEFDAFRQFERS